MKENDQLGSKKMYQAPELKVYGDVNAVTKAGTNLTMNTKTDTRGFFMDSRTH